MEKSSKLLLSGENLVEPPTSKLEPSQYLLLEPDFFEVQLKEDLIKYLKSKGINNIEDHTPESLYDEGIRNLKMLELTKRFSGPVRKFNGPYKLLESYFPDQIRPWLISGRHNGWLNDFNETAARATRWLFEDYMELPLGQIPIVASMRQIRAVGFGGLLATSPFNGNVQKFIDNAYPGQFGPEHFHKHRNRDSSKRVYGTLEDKTSLFVA